ncbi:MAG: hypothetical protein R2778_08060 [Saprospiraceae bacterium]
MEGIKPEGWSVKGERHYQHPLLGVQQQNLEDGTAVDVSERDLFPGS